ncbi:PREDICTED: SUN domain-containing protein 3 [Galeopterus variegatus]|uniref:SUN domain-containing protein 3 n=1 Tax=Galeopterus variegatus TaxID=482537 RepID=A0ABM0RZJ0_GALVR|nr:PREDICTED: SUN domain-containing protein 3 [Galeopterus variegatus]
MNVLLSGVTQSWKIILCMMFTLAFLLVGLQNYHWLKETEFPQKSRQLYAVIGEYGSRLHKYQARLRMPKEQLELLNGWLALLRDLKDGTHSDSGDAHGEPAEDHEHLDEMSVLVDYVLKKLREDQVQMADYALKSAGASIIEAGTSESYRNNKAKLYWHGIGFLNCEMPPDIILQPDVYPGKCWAFPGSQGYTLIKLARKIIPTAVTMEHISEKVSPSGNISSAPKEFSVYGITKTCEGEEIFLGQFLYNKTGTTVQTFELKHKVNESLLCVKLKVLSNWGHLKYTCLYRFRVHGTPGEHN